MGEDPLNNDHFLEAIQKIERENQQINPVQNIPKPVVPTPNTITSNFIHNDNRNVPLPQMYFPNSTVTINYNFHQK